jgi:uncharacterized membrane protein
MAIFATKKSTTPMWGRVAGDAIDLGALAALSQSKESHAPMILAAGATVAAVTALDLWTAMKLSNHAHTPNHVIQKITVGGEPQALYEMWRNPQHLACIMAHIATVVPAGENRTYWTLKGPGVSSVSWHSEYVDEKPGTLLRWHTDEHEPVVSDGVVRFEPAPAGRGTEVTLNFRIAPNGGPVSNAASRVFAAVPDVLTIRALRRFKSLAETGEIPTLDKNPTARTGVTANLI